MSIFGSEEKKDLANSYRVMMEMAAWKDLENFMNHQRGSSLKREDDKSASDITVGFVCEEKGIRKGIQMVIKHAEQRREGV